MFEILILSIIIIVLGFLNCITTYLVVKVHHTEGNPLIRFLHIKYGLKNAVMITGCIWFLFGLFLFNIFVNIRYPLYFTILIYILLYIILTNAIINKHTKWKENR